MTHYTADSHELQIDAEFQSLCPPLTPDEYAQLDANIVADCCLEPITTWAGHQDTILDGHNRYSICQEHRCIQFTIRALHFNTREGAIDWIINNQLGRRNLSDEQKRYLRGKKYLSEKKQGDRTDLTSAQNEQKLDTAGQLAEKHGVSAATIRRDADFAQGVDVIAEEEGQEAKADILSGKSKRTKKDVIDKANAKKRMSPHQKLRAEWRLRDEEQREKNKIEKKAQPEKQVLSNELLHDELKALGYATHKAITTFKDNCFHGGLNIDTINQPPRGILKKFFDAAEAVEALCFAAGGASDA